MKAKVSLFFFLLVIMPVTRGANSLFFNVSASTATSSPISITLCLNGNGPLSCQVYNVSGVNLNITTTIPNHNYPAVGIKINTPGYAPSGCTQLSNGYCIFSANNRTPSPIFIYSSNFWVAINGNDSASGDQEHPFLTIQHAKDLIRNNPLRGKMPITVYLNNGLFRVTETLSFDQNDSGTNAGPITYQAVVGATPIISGGTQVTGWTLHDAGRNIWQAQASISTATMPRQIYINGLRAVRARTQNNPNYFTPTSTGYTYQYPPSDPLIPITDTQYPPPWNNPSVIEAVTVTQWKMMRCPIAEITGGNNLVMQTPCWSNANTYPSPWNFQLLSWLENAYEFLNTPGQFYLDPVSQIIYYIPRVGENLVTADVELPILQTLVQGTGDTSSPVSYINFQGLTFEYATWLDINQPVGSNGSNGYVCDQSGFHLTGTNHSSALNVSGHDPNVTRTPGNLSFIYAQNIKFIDNSFQHLGAVALDFGTGSQNNQIINNTFNDISSAAIQVGGVLPQDHHPSVPAQLTSNNLIYNNLIENIGQEFFDAAGIFVGVTTKTTVEHNEIRNVPWSGIAIGWGWGLIDFLGFPGLPGATSFFMWGTYNTPSAAHGNQIIYNKIDTFLGQLWDGGAIYSSGFQGTSLADGQLIAWNLAQNKRSNAGGNTFYTDGGSRYVTLYQNVSLNNPVGYFDFGPCFNTSSFPGGLCLVTDVVHYGADLGGCIPYGDLSFQNNYLADITTFYDICSNSLVPGYPVNLSFVGNIMVSSSAEVPASILNSAGRI